MIKQELILQEKKDERNDLGLCHYCKEPGHIAIDYKNSALLATKKQTASALKNNSMALIPYKAVPLEEKEMFLG